MECLLDLIRSDWQVGRKVSVTGLEGGAKTVLNLPVLRPTPLTSHLSLVLFSS
jgi:hypothetical protein